MKTLILVRHAQAVDKSPVISDHDRPLTSKWIKQSKKLPKLLKKLDIKPWYVLSSTAIRCHDTAKQICKKFDLKLHTDAHLYFEWMESYLKLIASVTDDKDMVTIIWHNDDLTILICHLLNCNFPSVAKWSAIVIEFDIESWTEVKKSQWFIKYYITA